MSEEVKSEVLAIFSKDDLLEAAKHFDVRQIDLEEAGHPGKSVIVEELPAGLRDYWEASIIVDAQEGNTLSLKLKEDADENSALNQVAGELLRSRIVALSLVEGDYPNGPFTRMFGRGDEHKIKEWPSKLVSVIATECMKLNGISKDEFDQIKNESAAILSDDSNSDSQENSDALSENLESGSPIES